MNLPMILALVFFVSMICGYFLIRNVPSLLQTPLMSGMNALSGITLIGAFLATALALKETNGFLASLLGGVAIVVAAINVFGGFGITNRMLKMFKPKEKPHE